MKAKRTWLGLALAVLAALAVGSLVAPPGGADEQQLEEVKDGEVSNQGEQANDIDYDDEEETAPESVTPVGETVTIVSKTMTPPDDMAFKEFPSPNPWIYVDIETDPEAPPGSAGPDTASAIKISVEDVPETAGAWPLKGEGNLKPPGGGGGGYVQNKWHWSAKVAKASFKIVYPCDANGDGLINDPDDNEFVYWGAEDPVLSFGCEAEITGNIDPSNLRWTIEDVGTIRGTWNPHVAGDPYTGTGLNSVVSFSGMPDSNAAFGRKRITLRCVGMSESDTVDIEVFFDPLAKNNNGLEPDDIPPEIDLREVVIRAGQ